MKPAIKPITEEPMNAQTLTNPILACSLSPFFRLESLQIKTEIQASPREFGYEIDAAELEIELAALSPKNNQDLVNQDVQPQEFEACYTWFLS
jgi:hypothetical protein